MCIPDTLTRNQEEILITLRALAGLVAQALRQKVALGGADEDDARVLERANAEIHLWRALLLHHTRRLLPTLIGDGGERDYRQVAEWPSAMCTYRTWRPSPITAATPSPAPIAPTSTFEL